MYRDQLVVGLTVAFAAMSVWFAVLGLAFNPLIFAPAILFAVVTYFMWYHASGKLAERIYRVGERTATRQRRAATDGHGGFGAGPREAWERPGARSRQRVRQERGRRRQRAREWAAGQGRSTGTAGGRAGGGGPAGVAADPGMTRRQAAEVLGVEPTADANTVQSAYRDRVKEVHPDTEGGDEEQFKRVRDAYEALSE